MLGDFLRSNKRIPVTKYNCIKPGTPIVVWNEKWEYFMQFGIFIHKDMVVCQQFKYDQSVGYIFSIRRYTLNVFTDRHKNDIYEYIPKFEYDYSFAVNNALSLDNGIILSGLRSVLGDDFVLWCLVGNDRFIQMFNGSRMGFHYKVPRRMIAKYYHHVIAIEEGFIINFAVPDTIDEKIYIRITLQEFQDLKNPQKVQYTDDNLTNRLVARNRALMALTGVVQFGRYNLITNNCEHFAVWCKTGKMKSFQVYNAFMTLGGLAISYFTRRPNPIVINSLRKYLL